jgi:hypothetical protein
MGTGTPNPHGTMPGNNGGGLVHCLLLCWFLDAGNTEAPRARLTGVQKAPRHEVAGSWALAGQRVLWGFDVGADLDDRRDAGRIRPACLHGQEVGRAQ